MKKTGQKLLRLFAIAILFMVMALLVLAITVIALSHEAIGLALENIPRTLWDAILSFPIDWLIAGAVGAGMAFIACAIVWHIANTPKKSKKAKNDNNPA